MSEELKKLEELLANDRKIIEDNYKEIERLTKVEQEHQRINGELREENKRLNNIINELERYAGLGEINWEDKYQDIMLSSKGLLNRIKELKGVDKK